MNVFLDANILIAVLNKEYPLFSHAARIISLTGQKGFEMYTSPLCLAIAFYFAEKKSGPSLAKRKTAMLASHLHIAPCLESGVLKTIDNAKINDFKDGLEYYAALDAGCTIIVTEDTNDFWFSELAVMNAAQFIETISSVR